MCLLRRHLWLLFAVAVNCHFAPEPEEQSAPVDAFQMMASLPNLVAVYTSSPDPAYLCLDATLTYYDGKAKKSTYVWHFKSPVDHHTVVKEAEFDIFEGPTSDRVYFVLNENICRVYSAYYNYTDYDKCLVSEIPYNNEDLCILFVTKDVVDTIPEDCLSAYHAMCPEEYRDYDSAICDA